jgi:dTDP-4-dehydrorhamnose reductase
LIHISTDYIYANSNLDADEDATVPVHANNWYSYTKLLGDAHIQLMSKDYLIIRCSHKPKPFPYDKAWYNQWGNFDYVDVIANLIVRLVLSDAKGVYNVGTKCKRMFSLARETKPGIESITAPTNVPYDVSMNTLKMKTKLGDNL